MSYKRGINLVRTPGEWAQFKTAFIDEQGWVSSPSAAWANGPTSFPVLVCAYVASCTPTDPNIISLNGQPLPAATAKIICCYIYPENVMPLLDAVSDLSRRMDLFTASNRPDYEPVVGYFGKKPIVMSNDLAGASGASDQQLCRQYAQAEARAQNQCPQEANGQGQCQNGPTQDDFNRNIAANLLAIVNVLITKGLVSPHAYENKMKANLATVDRWQADASQRQGIIGAVEGADAVLNSVPPKSP